jgi:hypothetical protein
MHAYRSRVVQGCVKYVVWAAVCIQQFTITIQICQVQIEAVNPTHAIRMSFNRIGAGHEQRTVHILIPTSSHWVLTLQ